MIWNIYLVVAIIFIGLAVVYVIFDKKIDEKIFHKTSDGKYNTPLGKLYNVTALILSGFFIIFINYYMQINPNDISTVFQCWMGLFVALIVFFLGNGMTSKK